jgi:replicative DNA helicase
MAEIGNTAEVIVGKQRHGPIGTVKLGFTGAYTRFDNLAKPGRYDDYQR